MMLNTDICLLYNNGYDKYISARNDTCCAWKDLRIPAYQEIVKNMDADYLLQINKNTDDAGYCGVPWQNIPDIFSKLGYTSKNYQERFFSARGRLTVAVSPQLLC